VRLEGVCPGVPEHPVHEVLEGKVLNYQGLLVWKTSLASE
jgi:hypothetical protein